ncbi:hypothetical protein DMR_01590 [Solidesulfovibrio magneticus RS-1]|uniref:Uncharacterized protein n=1 Tax=Solidesulfovibrio magneticus (strain ATCC 700980 / DSM 13731 / RS-1) TaxID=573370 RepID=C4XTY5_SOLM1|nr:hypothetical protein DMR_01590 [Solidesulfovibrio magneticus RS-1]
MTPFSLPKRQRAPTLGFGGYVPGQNHLPAHLLDQETIPRSLEFFSRGRPPSASFAPVKNNPLLYAWLHKKINHGRLGGFQAIPPILDFWTFRVHPLKIFWPRFLRAETLADPARERAAATGL